MPHTNASGVTTVILSRPPLQVDHTGSEVKPNLAPMLPLYGSSRAGLPVSLAVVTMSVHTPLFLHSRKLLVGALSMALVACGGGGGASGSSATPVAGDRVPNQAEGASSPSVASATDEWATAQSASAIAYPTLVSAGYLKGRGWASTVTAPDTSSDTYTPQFTGRGWYVDVDNGSDTNPGTMTLPWRTLQRATSARANAGDALLLKCGGVWRESLEITTGNFAPNGRLLIGGYGDCTHAKRPVIKGSDLVSQTGWQKASGGSDQVYVRPYGQVPQRMFIGGKPLFNARFPNYAGVGNEYALAVGNASATSFTVAPGDLSSLAGKALVGATVYMHTLPWQIDKAQVTQFDAGTGRITLDHALAANIESGVGYILEGKRWMLDAPGEWWYDTTNSQLYVWTPTGASPATIDSLEASWRPYGLTVRWTPDLRVEQLQFEQQSDTALLLVETARVAISGIYSAYAGEYGISVLSADNALVQNSEVSAAGRVGLSVREGAAVHVLNNKVSDTGLFGRADSTDSGIFVIAQGTVEGNLVQRSANLGIRFGNRAGTVVRNNTVLAPCVRLTDCAGIYTFTASAPTPAPTAFSAKATVDGNIVIGARSNANGLGPYNANQAVGIYLDELTSGTTVSNNLIVDTEVGMALHNAAFNILINNKVRGSNYASFRATLTRTDADVMRGNTVINNAFETHRGMKSGSGGLPEEGDVVYAQYWFHATDASKLFTGTNPNVVTSNDARSVQSAADARWRIGWNGGGTTYGINGWRNFAPTDTQSNLVTFKPFLPVLSGPSLIDNALLATGSPLWTTYFSSSGVGGTFSSSTSSLCAIPPCGRLVTGTSSDYLASPAFTLDSTAGQNLYLLRYSATGGPGGGLSRAMIRRQTSPYENYGLSVAATDLSNGQTLKVETYFNATGGQNAVLDFRSKVAGETYLSGVTLHRVQSIDFLNLLTTVGSVINTGSTSASYTCDMLSLRTCDVVDDTGATVSWPMTIGARSVVTLYDVDTTWLAP